MLSEKKTRPTHRRRLRAAAILAAAALAGTAAAASVPGTEPAKPAHRDSARTPLPLPARAPADDAWLGLHETVTLGWQAEGLELRNSDAVFAWVFRHLPPEVRVYPTENYYYWRLLAGGREIRGNFRPASGLREKGIVSFAYQEWLEFPDGVPERDRIYVARRLGAEEGVTVACPDPFTCDISSEGKTVRFHLVPLPQLPPAPGLLGPEERFVSRTRDESGLEFFLCYHKQARCFFWILNEEASFRQEEKKEAPRETGAGGQDLSRPGGRVAEIFTDLGADVVLGRRTGFVFLTEKARAGRKLLAAVRKASVDRNDYYDGPFDQLADNYAAQVPLRQCIEEVWPSLKGQIDLHGYYLSGPETGNRVALTSYLAYGTVEEARDFAARAAASPAPPAAVAAGGMNR